MDYHSHIFQDFSLLIYKKDKLIALLPANLVNEVVYSHKGLTYGSLVFQENFSSNEIDVLFHSVCDFCKGKRVKELYIKQVPEIYNKEKSSVLDYILAQKGELYRRDMVLAIDYSKPIEIHKTKLKHYKRSRSVDFEIKETNEFSNFWRNVLEPRLSLKHNVKPVHSLEEIELLNKRFPNNIKQFDLYLEDEIVAGITIFENDTIVKSQYGAITEKGEQIRALDFLFLELIYKYKKDGKRFFSMGTVSDFNKPENYNKGLLKQKEELGCSVFLQDFFKIKL